MILKTDSWRNHASQHDCRKDQQPYSQGVAHALRECKNAIIDTWEYRVRDCVAGSNLQSSSAIRNTLGVFLDELVLSFEKDLSPTSETSLAHTGMSRQHGQQRATYAGYELPQVLKEFSLLRTILTEFLHENDLLTFRVRAVLDAAIDSTISLAATEFSAVHQSLIQTSLEKAKSSNLDLEHFAAIAAHDMKSPLATISGYLGIVIEDFEQSLPPECITLLGTCSKISSRMRSLIDSLLDYAQLSEAKREFKFLDMNLIVQSVRENLHNSLTNSGSEIRTFELPYLYGDPDLLSQLVQNLFANSLKFAGNRPACITLRAKREELFWRFECQDQGIGFDPKFREEIFSLYKKLNPEGKFSGSGIGLATCRRIAEIHSGKIWAESTVGHGSTFYFELPIRAEILRALPQDL